MKTFTLSLTALVLFSSFGHAQVTDKKGLTLDGARRVIGGALEYARANKAPGGVIAVVDDGGNLMALERLDGTFAAGANISIGKARTSALFKKPTKFFEDVINKGRTAMAAMHENFTPLQGGVPILVEGQVVGAVGVSGASSAQQDEELALAGAAALEENPALSATSPNRVLKFAAKEVDAGFANDAHLVQTETFKVNASGRTMPGAAEVHERETDIFYVVEGSASFVTGGKVVDPKPTEPGQVRGSAIAGGETQQVRKGDVVIVPEGTPHQFTQVNGPFHYFVVKSLSPATAALTSR